MKIYRLKTMCIALSLVSTACAPPMPAPQAPENKPMTIEQRRVDIKEVTRWQISGAMAARSGNKGWSASIDWQQFGSSNYKIRLFGPLGSGNVLITRRGNTVSYRDGNKKASSSNASSLLKQETGVSLPVANLYYWVRGIPAPSPVSNTHYDRFNHLRAMNQSGYHIQYLSFTSVNGTDLPSKIAVTGNKLKIKFIIKRWALG